MSDDLRFDDGVFVLVLGTRNRKKKNEMWHLLDGCRLRVETLDELDVPWEVEETGQSFAQNACLKATQYASHLRQWVLGEDSGLSVDALDGAPGVRSSRFAGPHATDQENNDLLLDKLKGIPLDRRTAHYTCHVAVADPTGSVRFEVEDYCHGRILLESQGDKGFGYDPLFEIPEYHQSFGQLGDSVKAVLSHRARALKRTLPQLIKWAGHHLAGRQNDNVKAV